MDGDDDFILADKDDLAALEAGVDRFAEAMKEKLRDKAHQGWDGWDRLRAEDTQGRAMSHLLRMYRGDATQDVDVANFMMFHFAARTR